MAGDSLSFREIVAGRKACTGYNEPAFLKNLQRTARYRIVNGILELTDHGEVISRWARKEKPAASQTA